jgi:competence protein ComEC
MSPKRYHVSWLLASVSFGILIGVVLSVYLDANYFSGVEWLIVGLCLSLASFINRKFLAILLLILAGISIGLWRGSNVGVEISAYDEFYGQNVEVQGRVAEDPGIANDGDAQLRLKDVTVNDVKMTGQLWVNTSDRIEIRRSDLVKLEGQLSRGFGNIPASLYRANIVSVKRQAYADVGRDVRDSFAVGVREAIKEPEASLATGFLVGQKTALPEKLDNELRLLGLTHIVVASGYNLTILVRFARRFFEKISRFTALASAGFLVFGFMQVTGLSPSMARASLITGLSLMAWYYGRKIHPFVLLPFAAAITVLLNPSYAWGDIGWLLSFTSFIGVIILSPLIHLYFWNDKKPGAIRQVVLETMSAQIFTLPIIAYIFGQYSPIALLANVLILPLIPLAMLLTFIAGLIALVGVGVAPIVGFPAQLVLSYMTSVVDWLSTWPIASEELKFTKTALVVSYIGLFWVVLFLWRKSGHEFREYNVIE